MSGVDKAWEEYREASYGFDYYVGYLHRYADRLERAEKELDRLLETPEKKKLREIEQFVNAHLVNYLGCDIAAKISDMLDR